MFLMLIQEGTLWLLNGGQYDILYFYFIWIYEITIFKRD